jgi:chromosome segregation ATPase
MAVPATKPEKPIRELMSLFGSRTISQIPNTDEKLNFELSQFSLELESSTKLLTELNHRITDLLSKQDSLTTSLSEKEQPYSNVQSQIFDILRSHSLPDSSGSYFCQMNALGLMETELRGEISGRTTAVHKLSESIKF